MWVLSFPSPHRLKRKRSTRSCEKAEVDPAQQTAMEVHEKGGRDEQNENRSRRSLVACGPPQVREMAVDIARAVRWAPLEDWPGRRIFQCGTANMDVEITDRKVCFGAEDGYQLSSQVQCDGMIHKLYSQQDESVSRAPRGLPRAVLTRALQVAVEQRIFTPSSLILLEADPSKDGKLEKMYIDMGFEMLGRAHMSDYVKKEGLACGALMGITVGDLLAWGCTQAA